MLSNINGEIPMAKMGRPRKEIDFDVFEKLCAMQCTLEEVAGFFEMTEDTLNERLKEKYGDTYSGVYKIYSQQGKVSLRRKQFNLADRSASMAIWLGKQYLDQKDLHISSEDMKLRDTEYVILNDEEKEEAKKMLKDFEG